MDIYNEIKYVSKIIGIELNPLPILYENTTTIYHDDVIDNCITYRILQRNDIFVYLYTETKYPEHTRYSEIKTKKDVYDIFIEFVKDSYYDSPILFSNLKRIIENNTDFESYYNKHPTYFYMGLYKSDGSDDLKRVYVRRNKEECYNEYITEMK